MEKNYKNKQITDTETKTPQTNEGALEDFFFAGGGEYEPLTVQARSREEAEEIWQKQRKKVEPAQKINE